MKEAAKPVELIVAIVFAAVLIAGSVVFLGLQLAPQTEDVADTPSTPPFDAEQLKQELKMEITSEILAEVQNTTFIDPVIDAAIQRYVARQQEAQEKARAEQQRLAQEKAKNVPRVDLERDHIYGNPEAVISLIEYSDFECPFCKTFHPNPKKVVDDSDGKVNLVYRHYPLGFHNPGAQKQAEASECAAELGGNEAFWKYADAIYDRTTSNGNGFPLENLVPLAEELGLDSERFRECLDSGKYAELVQNQLKDGTNSGITGTPGTIILNNKTGEARLASGALPPEQLQANVQQLLSQE
jgi:protein-disulfide isomerase